MFVNQYIMSFDFGSLLQAIPAIFSKNYRKQLTGSGLTDAQKETMSYNSHEAQVNREFQSAESQLARQWQEDFYTKYQSPQAQVRQYESAGLNPALMYGRGVTPISASGASNGTSGSQASTTMPVGDPMAMISLMSNIAKLPSEIEAMQSQSDLNNAKTVGQNISNNFSPQIFDQQLRSGEVNIQNTLTGMQLAQHQISNLDSQTLLNEVKGRLTDAQISDTLASADLKTKQAATEILKQSNLSVTNDLLAAQIQTERLKLGLVAAQTVLASQQAKFYGQNAYNMSLDSFQKEWDNQMTSMTGMRPPKNMFDMFYNLAGGIAVRADKGLSKLKSGVKSFFKRYTYW